MTKPIPENAVWLITGCSSGLGQHLSQLLAKSNSYRVVATARQLSALSYLPDTANILKLELDVTSQTAITTAVAAAVSKYGCIDVLVNNAGYALMGDAESATDTESRDQMETNFWGAVNMTKAVLPILRAGHGGVIVQISSMGGFVGFPGSAFYHASKFALEGFTEGIAREMLPEWNIRFLLLEQGAMRTKFAAAVKLSERHPAYAVPAGPTSQLFAYIATPGLQDAWAEPDFVARTLVGVVVSDDIPLRLPMGSDAWGLIKMDVDGIVKDLEKWKTVSEGSSSAQQMEKVAILHK